MRPWAYSSDLRRRAVAAYDSGDLTEVEIAALFGIGEATLRRWRRQVRETGSLEPMAHTSGNKPRVDEVGAVVVRRLVEENPDATIDAFAVMFVERTLKPCSPSSMGRALLRLGLTRKKSP